MLCFCLSWPQGLKFRKGSLLVLKLVFSSCISAACGADNDLAVSFILVKGRESRIELIIREIKEHEYNVNLTRC